MKRLLVVLLLVSVGCAKPWPDIQPPEVEPLTPASSEWRVTDHVILITDASGTMGREALIPEARAVTRAFVAGLPAIDVSAERGEEYEASLIAFGGGDRIAVDHAPLNRVALREAAADINPLGPYPLGGSTPLDAALGEAAASLQGKRGRAALVIIGDGRADDPAGAVAATRSLVSSHPDPVCIHVVHVGNDGTGRALLEQLSGLSTGGCGSVRAAQSVADAGSVTAFERQVLLGARPLPPVAAAPSGCDGRIVLRGVTFEFDRAEIRSESRPILDVAAEQLRSCADKRVAVEGHTCSIGTDAYNTTLAQRRAAAVRDYLVQQGVSSGQLEPRGVGEAKPVASNDSRDGRAQNRRVELVPQD